MSLSDLSIKNPVFAVMLSAAMLVFGYLGYRDLGISQFPELDFPVVNVTTYREAALPETMDSDVTDIIEDAVSVVEGIDYMTSQSSQGVSVVTIFFHLYRDIDAAMQDVQNAVAAAMQRLPTDIDPPVVSKVNFNKFPVMWLSCHGTRPLPELSRFVDDHLKRHIQGIPGVGGVMYGGLRARNMRIWLDRTKLQAYHLDPVDVMQAVRAEHIEKPAGYLQSDTRELNVRTMGEGRTVEDFEQLPVSKFGGQIIRLRDVAVIEDGLEDRRSLARFNSQPTVGVGVMRAMGANVVQVCNEVKQRLPELRKLLPPGMELSISTDFSLFIIDDIEEVKEAMLLGIALTALVTFFFLGAIGPTLNVCISIPTSLIGTFLAIKWFGFTINFMTLLALSLSVGVVVDDAILVLENIYRRREHGEDKRTAALLGAREITFAAVAATFSIIAIFIPVAFLKGSIGRFFIQFAVTTTAAVLLSLVISLTITPMLCAYFLNVKELRRPRPRPRPWRLACLAGCLVVLLGNGLRLTATAWPEAAAWAWWPVALGTSWAPASWHWPTLPRWHELAWWWQALGAVAASGVEFAAAAAIVRFGNVVYWFLDRFVLQLLLIRPTDWLLAQTARTYRWALDQALRHQWWVIPASGGLAASALVFVFGIDLPTPWGRATIKPIGTELVPSEDQNRLLVNVICPVGSSIDYVDDMLAKGEKILRQLVDPVTGEPVVATYFTAVSMRPGQLVSEGIIFVRLIPPVADDGRTLRTLHQNDIIAQIRKLCNAVPGMRAVVLDLSTQGFTATRGYPVDFAVQGPDWSKVTEFAERIRHRLLECEAVTDVNSDYRPGMPEVHVVPDAIKAGELGVPVSRIAYAINVAVGGQRNGRFTDLEKRYDVRVRLLESQRSSPDQLDDLYVKNDQGKLIALRDVVRRETISMLPVINRYNHMRKVQLTANTAPGVPQGEALNRALEIVDEVREEMELPPAYRVVVLGNAQAMQETLDSLWWALALGFIVAAMILGVQFNSFVHPFTVLLAVPFGVTGALATLWWCGDRLNFMSMIGMVLLAGLVKKNSIILVDYTNQLRAEGLGLREAVLTACPVRLRPILMTTFATVAAALPLALGLGPGAETRAPLARSIIGGITLSTLVTLIIVPIFYVLFDRFGSWVCRLAERPTPAADADSQTKRPDTATPPQR
ncbi:MAG: efflux RND transporter permease subunit [Gemmataceae bacterium]|nr:efflux RND transporter permease subunit [Gemmataceae bacterium]